MWPKNIKYSHYWHMTVCFSVTLFGLKWTPIHQLTQNLGFNILFHSYIYDHKLEQAICTCTCGVNIYVPWMWENCYISLYSVTYIWLRQKAIQQLTQNLCLNIPFHPYIHDQDLEQAFEGYFSYWLLWTSYTTPRQSSFLTLLHREKKKRREKSHPLALALTLTPNCNTAP